MKSILDRSFRYTPSFETNLKATFARVKRERKAAAEKARTEEIERILKVRPMVRVEK